MRGLWGSLEQRLELAAGLAGRPPFEGSAAGKHHADDRPGQVLADSHCTHQGEQGDDVDPQSTAEEALDSRSDGQGDPTAGDDDPDQVPLSTRSSPVEEATDYQSAGGNPEWHERAGTRGHPA